MDKETETKKIELTAPHRHRGRDYPVGATLTLPVGKADWLIGLKRAKEPGASAEAAPAIGDAPAEAADVPAAETPEPAAPRTRAKRA